MSRTIFHFEINMQGDVRHSYYTALEALILDNEEELNISRSTLQKWSASKKNEIRHENWVIRRGTASTTQEVRDYYRAYKELGPEGFESKE